MTGGLLSGCSSVQDLSAVSSNVTVSADIEFATYEQIDQQTGEAKRQSLQLDLYQPVRSQLESWPVIVYIHGGGWEEFTRKSCPGEAIAQYDYTVACISYRYSQEARFPAQIHDVKAAVRWLRANANIYHLNPDKIGAMGLSAGGHLSALLGTSAGVLALEGEHGYDEFSSEVQAVVDWFGPTDFSQIPLAYEGIPTPEEFQTLKDRPWAHLTRVVTQLIGGTVADNPEPVALANPISFITPDDPPFWILHGTKDTVVPISQSELLVEALQAQNVPVEFYRDEQRGHDTKGDHQEAIAPEIMAQTMTFFDHHLK
ncbi:MAG: alpha/beta hydrolase [Phormidesmis sp. RL_2_1]|nr:alpha/beta hydrolase [Phormidesmis sp. RL_2_1]